MPEPVGPGACFGFRVRSELDLAFLRDACGDQALEEELELVVGNEPATPSTEPVAEWVPPSNPTHVKVFAEASGYLIWIDGAGWFEVDPQARRVVVPRHADPLRREERIWGLPVLFCLLARGDIPLHAAAVQIGGRAVLLAAPSGFGKTTLAAAFVQHGYRLLSEDLSCIRSGDTPSVIPGPTMLRVRRDVAGFLDFEGVEELGRDEDRVHLAVRTSRGSCTPVPLAGVVFLNAGDADPTLEPAGGADAVRNLWTVSFNLPTDEDRARLFRAVAALSGIAPTWNLTRRLEITDLAATVACLVDAFEDRG